MTQDRDRPPWCLRNCRWNALQQSAVACSQYDMDLLDRSSVPTDANVASAVFLVVLPRSRSLLADAVADVSAQTAWRRECGRPASRWPASCVRLAARCPVRRQPAIAPPAPAAQGLRTAPALRRAHVSNSV
jgi:hypothetical protein